VVLSLSLSLSLSLTLSGSFTFSFLRIMVIYQNQVFEYFENQQVIGHIHR
jgi:hypothetical protein